MLLEQRKSPSNSPRRRTFTKIEAQPDGGEIPAPTLFDAKRETGNSPASEELIHLIETEFDAMLAKFKEAIAENEWQEIQSFRGVFLERANAMPQRRQTIFDKLQRYKNGVQLMPEEHPEHNSAKAKDIKRDLEKFLS